MTPIDPKLPTASGTGASGYLDVVKALPSIVERVIPPGAIALVVSHGDDELLALRDRHGWHFPQDDKGEYAGHHPASGPDAVEHLKHLEGKGARFLVFPSTASWWLDHYAELGAYLEAQGSLVWQDDHCRIYRLGRDRMIPRAYRSSHDSRLAPAVRSLQHRLGRSRRSEDAAAREHNGAPRQVAPVSVIITSHNKAPFLDEALSCIEAQTIAPTEVVVVDDASTDAAMAVAATHDVDYERVAYESPALARNHGASLASGEYLCFYDADDLIDSDFLEIHLEMLRKHPHAGFAYGRIREFGARDRLWPRQDWDFDLLRRWNYVPAANVVRTAAFWQAGGYPNLDAAEDWGLWLRLSRAGWQGGRCETTWKWRRTADSRNARRTWGRQRSWYEEVPLSCLTVGIFTAFSERHVLDGWSNVLRTITWPKERVNLWLYDDSRSDEFNRALRAESASLEGFGGVHVVRSSRPEDTPTLADAGSAHSEQRRSRLGPGARLARAYTWAAQHVDTDLIAFLGDDIVPAMGGRFLEALIQSMNWETQAVYGWYPSDGHTPLVVAKPRDPSVWHWRLRTEPGTGVSEVGGGGMGCVVMRRESLRGRTFTPAAPLHTPDPRFAREMWGERRQMLCNWEVQCRRV